MGVIIKPIVTEKANQLSEKLNQYAFRVAKDANKLQIQQEIEALYGVTVLAVNTMTVLGKNKTRYTKRGIIDGQAQSYKKAVVTVKEGDKIDFYGNI